MTFMSSPLVRYRRLAVEFRQLRRGRKLTSDDLAERAGVHRQRISEIENAQKRPSMPELRKMLRALDATPEEWQRITRLAADANFLGWWIAYPDLGKRQSTFVDLESGAATIREYQNFVIPGLVQVPEYMWSRGRFTAWELGDDGYDIAAAVEARKARQDMVRRQDGPSYEAIIEEAAVRRPSAPPHVMADQIRHLADLADDAAALRVRILMTNVEIDHYWLPKSAFSMYTYPDPKDPVAVLVDTEVDDLVYIAPEAVRPYANQYDRLNQAAMSYEESAVFLRDLAAQFAALHSDPQKKAPR